MNKGGCRAAPLQKRGPQFTFLLTDCGRSLLADLGSGHKLLGCAMIFHIGHKTFDFIELGVRELFALG